MSRTTNSMLLRYGINNFWSSSFSKPRLSQHFLQLNTFFNLFLRNYFLHVLKIQYSDKSINIYIFYLSDNKFTFLYKYLKLNRFILNNLNTRLVYGFNKNEERDKIFLRLKNLTKLSILHSYFKILFSTKKLFSVSLMCDKIFNSFFYNFLLKKIVSKKNNCFFYKWKLYMINNIVKLKLLSLVLSFIVFLYTKNKFVINLKSILEKKQDVKLPFFFNFNQNLVFKTRLYVIYLSFVFFKASILNFYLNSLILEVKNKKHVNSIISFYEGIKFLFIKQISPIGGIKFQISGRLNGKLRKSKFGFTIGNVKLMSFALFCNYSCDYVYTQYGSFSLKLWLCANNEIYNLSKY